jgi:membrane-bound ClpP family serine protease
MNKVIRKHEDRAIFYVCLAVAIVLLLVSFFMPPRGVIDPSVLKAAAILLGFAALGIVGKNLSLGKDVTFSHGDTEVTIGESGD